MMFVYIIVLFVINAQVMVGVMSYLFLNTRISGLIGDSHENVGAVPEL